MKARRRSFCLPRACVDDVTDLFDQVLEGATNESFFVLHSGTNDVRQTRSEKLLDKYRKLFKQCKTKSSKIVISGVLPKITTDSVFYSKAFSLKIDWKPSAKNTESSLWTWNDFYNKTGLFEEDGLQLSPVGPARFTRLLNETVRRFWYNFGANSQGY